MVDEPFSVNIYTNPFLLFLANLGTKKLKILLRELFYDNIADR